jgi:anti-anti-sigma factor
MPENDTMFVKLIQEIFRLTLYRFIPKILILLATRDKDKAMNPERNRYRFRTEIRKDGCYPEIMVATPEFDELDYSSCIDLRHVVDDILRGTHPLVVMDLSGVEVFDSTALGILLSLNRELHDADREFTLIGSPRVCEILHLTRVDSLFDTADSVNQAIACTVGPEPAT